MTAFITLDTAALLLAGYCFGFIKFGCTGWRGISIMMSSAIEISQWLFRQASDSLPVLSLFCAGGVRFVLFG